jgi:hypothetical protein
MGHFIIDLPENKRADVRWGKVFKKRSLSSLFHKNKSEYKKGYIVNIIDSNIKTEYRFFKSQIDEWSKDPDGQIKLDKTDLHIRDAIIEKEKELNIN